jgi:phosphoenolpyruvate carboxylase
MFQYAVQLVTEALDIVVREQEGEGVLKRVEEIRRLTRRLRSRYAARDERRLRTILHGASVSDLAEIGRAFTLFFWLLNVCEQRHTARSRRRGEPGSFAALFRELERRRVPREVVAKLLEDLRATVVLTAHPTEAMRWSVSQSLARIDELLELHRSGKSAEAEGQLLCEITALWQTTVASHRAPTPIDEVRHAVHTLERVLVHAVPDLVDRLTECFVSSYGRLPPETLQPVGLGSWIGGDRDGNPFVTAQVTTDSLQLYRRAILTHYWRAIPPLIERLTMSAVRVPVTEALRESVKRDLAELPRLRARVEGRSPEEVYRQKLNAMAVRLELGLEENDALDAPGSRGGYQDSEVFRRDLELIRQSLIAGRASRLADGRLGRLCDEVDTFGFYLVTLDIRQHNARHREARAELICPVEGRLDDLPLKNQQAFLDRLILQPEQPEPPDEGLSPDTLEVLETLRGVQKAPEHFDPRAVCDLVISETQSEIPALELLALARGAGLVWLRPDGSLESHVDIVPLFESIEGMRTAPDAMQTLYTSPAYRKQLEARGMRQQVMLGYSDSVKDGGYLAACFGLNEVQRELVHQADRFGVGLEFFHGRGGTIARGGGPTHKAILAQPPSTVRGRIKLTEQGEMIAHKYGSVPQAVYHLEQIVSATVEASLPAGTLAKLPSLPPVWREAMARLSERSREAYRALVYDDPQFVDAFYAMTPIEEIFGLRIGSRPAKRAQSRRIQDLRAISWTFAWNQSRVLLPSWYGAGTAFEEFLATEKGGRERALSRLRAMYRGWPFFRTVIENLSQVLAKADLRIAANYAALAKSVPGSKEIFERIRKEFRRTVRAVLAVSREPHLLDSVPLLRQSLEVRAPSLDALSYLQVELLERKRTGRRTNRASEDADRLDRAVRLAITGAAAGLRNTG